MSLKTPAQTVPPTPGTALQQKIEAKLEKSLGDSLNIHLQHQMGSFQASMLEAFQSLRDKLTAKKEVEVDQNSASASKSGPAPSETTSGCLKCRAYLRPATLSSWLKQTILLCYKQADQQSLDLVQVKAQDIRAFAASKAYYGGASVDQIMQACHWKAHNTFTNFYLKDLTWSDNNKMYLGPAVAAQVLDPSPQTNYPWKEKKGGGTSATTKSSGVQSQDLGIGLPLKMLRVRSFFIFSYQVYMY